MTKTLLICALFSSTVMAQELNVAALQACSMVENDVKRLICYDNVIKGEAPIDNTKPTSTPEIQGKALIATTPQATQTTVVSSDSEFGIEHKNIIKDDLEEITATVTQVKKAPHGELIITLSNNQVWRQIGNDSLRLKADNEVTISRGAFNSFLLKRKDKNKAIRVKRTK